MPILEVLELPRFQLFFDEKDTDKAITLPRLRHITMAGNIRILCPRRGQESEMALRSLHTLHLYSGPGGGSVRRRKYYINKHYIFLPQMAEGLGLSLKVLDFTRCWGYTRDFRSLEKEMPGIKVIWSVNFPTKPTDYREYICGSETPDMLKISCTAPVLPEHDSDCEYFSRRG